MLLLVQKGLPLHSEETLNESPSEIYLNVKNKDINLQWLETGELWNMMFRVPADAVYFKKDSENRDSASGLKHF